MDLLKKLKYAGLCAGVAAIAYSGIAGAANPEDTTVTIMVDNTITVTKTADMNFGKVVAVANATGTAAIVIAPATGVVTGFSAVPGGARFVMVDNSLWSSLHYTATAVPSAQLSVTYGNTTGGAPVTLTCTTGCTGTPPTFVLDTYTHSAVAGSVGPMVANAGTVTTPVGGTADIRVGGTLSTVTSATPYQTGTYTGTLRITMSY